MIPSSRIQRVRTGVDKVLAGLFGDSVGRLVGVAEGDGPGTVRIDLALLGAASWESTAEVPVECLHDRRGVAAALRDRLGVDVPAVLADPIRGGSIRGRALRGDAGTVCDHWVDGAPEVRVRVAVARDLTRTCRLVLGGVEAADLTSYPETGDLASYPEAVEKISPVRLRVLIHPRVGEDRRSVAPAPRLIDCRVDDAWYLRMVSAGLAAERALGRAPGTVLRVGYGLIHGEHAAVRLSVAGRPGAPRVTRVMPQREAPYYLYGWGDEDRPVRAGAVEATDGGFDGRLLGMVAVARELGAGLEDLLEDDDLPGALDALDPSPLTDRSGFDDRALEETGCAGAYRAWARGYAEERGLRSDA